MKNTLTILGAAAAIAALALTGCSPGGDSAAEHATASSVLTDGTWLSAPIDEVGGGPGTVLHQKKLLVDGADVQILRIDCDGEATPVATGSVEGDQLTITEADEGNGFGSAGARIRVEPAGGGFQASVHGFGFSAELQFRADEFAQKCGE